MKRLSRKNSIRNPAECPLWQKTNFFLLAYKRFLLGFVAASLFLGQNAVSATKAVNGRQLRFEGIPVAMSAKIRARFPFVFERPVSLGEADEVLRFLMSSQAFSGVEIVERAVEGQSTLIMQGRLLKRIAKIEIQGNRLIDIVQIKKILKIESGQAFERKNLLASAEDLQQFYSNEGFLNPQIDIDFETPNETEINVRVQINEGQSCTITEVNLESANKDIMKKTQILTRQLQKQRLSDENVLAYQKSINEFLSTNRYLAAKLNPPTVIYNENRTQAKLNYLIDNPYRYEFVFDGNRYFSGGPLINALELEKFFGSNTSPIADLSERLRRLYLNHGFAHVQVSATDKQFEKIFKQQIRFKVVEGPRVRIRSLKVDGTLAQQPIEYSKYVNENSSDLVSRGYFSRTDVEVGYKNLIFELQNLGFLKAKVSSLKADFSANKSFVDLVIDLDEGPLTQIQKVKFNGNLNFSGNQLEDLLQLKAGQPLSLKTIESSVQQLKDHYRENGFLEMKLLNETEGLVSYNETGTQASIEYEIIEGPKIKVRNIALQGNSFTRDEVIQRELDFKVGDTLTQARVEESTYRLQKLGLFSSAAIKTLEENTTIADRTTIIQVAERDPGLFSSGVGINNKNRLTYRGYLGFDYRNLFGSGRGVSARLDLDYSQDPAISFLENKVTFGYLEPYILNRRIRGRINLTREQKFLEFDQTKNQTIISEDNSIEFLAERDLTRHVRLTYKAWGFSRQKTFVRDTKDDIQTVDIAKLGPVVEFDFRDDAFNPKRGTYSRIALEYSDPNFGSSRQNPKKDPNDADFNPVADKGITVQFAKITAGTTHYLPLWKKSGFNWSNSLRGGYLNNISHTYNGGVPSSEAFFLGGQSTLRGFDGSSELERVPNIQQLKIDKYQDFRVTRDSWFFLFKSEFRIPISEIVGFAIFYDAGGVILNEPAVQKRNSSGGLDSLPIEIKDVFRDSAGFGLRIDTPAGPVRADLAFKLDRQSYGEFGELKESPYAIHLSIGAF